MKSKLQRSALIRMLSSIRVGVTILALILIYASLGSALPQLRGAVELTEMDVFRHPVFVILCAAFTIVLVVATLTRIPFRMVNAGVLTVHTGLLLLVGGSVVYFGTKIEGDVKLDSPRIRIISGTGATERVIGEMLAEAGQAWNSFMPAFGGNVSIEIAEVDRAADGRPLRAKLRAASVSGQGDLTLEADQAGAPIGDGRLSVRLVTFPTQTEFFDDETPALYIARPGTHSPDIQPIHGLPIYRERYLDGDQPLLDTAGRIVHSKRPTPHVALAGLNIPTGLLEPWRLPIHMSPVDAPFDIEITGFVPYVGRLDQAAGDGGPMEDPAVNLRLEVKDVARKLSLFSKRPAHSAAWLGIPVEFRWVESTDEMADILRDAAGPHELEIEVLNPPTRQRVAIHNRQTIQVEGTPYTLTVRELRGDWPMMTAGYEGASSPMASVDVKTDTLSYNRTVIQRFPQLSQDIDETGFRHREGPYDPNLILRYRTSAEGWIVVAAGPGIEPALGFFDATGRVQRFDLAVGKKHELNILGETLAVTLEGLFERGRMSIMPVLEPLETRRPNLAARAVSAVRLKFIGRGPSAGWSDTQWCMFSMYPDTEARPIRVHPPGGDAWDIIYSRFKRPLHVELVPGKLAVKHFPGRDNVESWRSEFLVVPKDGPVLEGTVYTNATFSTGEWTLYQSGAARDGWSYTILGVGNREGIWPMVLGCVLITIGCLFAFYVKPVLLRRAARRGRSAVVVSEPPKPHKPARTEPELAGMR